MEETLFEVKDQLSRSGVVNSNLAIPLFDSLLRVALAEVSSCPEPPEEKPERVSYVKQDFLFGFAHDIAQSFQCSVFLWHCCSCLLTSDV